MRKSSIAAAVLSTAVLAACTQGAAATLGSTGASQSTVPEIVTVAAAGDISCDQGPDGERTCRDRATSDLILADPSIDRVLTLGDNQYETGTLSDFNAYYDDTWGRFKSMTRPTTGNHDHEEGYYDYWGALAGPRGKGYYAFDLGDWRLYAINTSIDMDQGSEQYAWLEADLRENPRRCVLAYGHHPRWSSAKHGSQERMAPIWNLLYDHGVEMLLSGHDHNYERFARFDKDGNWDPDSGTRQFVVGTGGRGHYHFENIMRGSQVRDDNTYGVLKLDLSPIGYSWEFVPTPDGSFTDSGQKLCH